jgi:hypothetical protein
VTAAAWKTKPSWFIVTADDRVVPLASYGGRSGDRGGRGLGRGSALRPGQPRTRAPAAHLGCRETAGAGAPQRIRAPRRFP